MVSLTYIGPHDEVDVPAIGRFVKQGESVEVPAEVAGSAASGEGLLAQPDNWRRSGTKAAKQAADEKENG